MADMGGDIAETRWMQMFWICWNGTENQPWTTCTRDTSANLARGQPTTLS